MITIKDIHKEKPSNTELDIVIPIDSVLHMGFVPLENGGVLKENKEQYRQRLNREFFANHNQPIKDELIRIAKISKYHNVNLFVYDIDNGHGEVIRDFINEHLLDPSYSDKLYPITLQHIEI